MTIDKSAMDHPRGGGQLMVPVSESDHAIGPAEAPVTVVEYGDFECPNCKQAAPAVALLRKRYAGRLRFVFRHFPLTEVHPHALQTAEAAECAAREGKFWPMHDLVFDHQSHLDVSDLSGYAARLQLDMKRFEADMDSHAHLQRIGEDIRGGRDSGVRSTPTFFVNGRIEDVSFGLQRLFDAVELALIRSSREGGLGP